MKNSKIILLLKTLTPSEVRAFGKFVRSPFFNKKEEVVRMWEALRRTAPTFPEKNVERRRIMRQVMPGQAFDEKRYKHYANTLLKLAERYLAIQGMEARPMLSEYYLMDEYVKRNVDKNYQFVYKKANDIQRDAEQRDADFYLREYLLQNVASEHLDRKRLRRNNEFMKNSLQALDNYYFFNKLKHSCHVLNNQKIISGNTSTEIPGEILGLLAQYDFSTHPAIHIYFVLYQLLSSESAAKFEEIRDALEYEGAVFHPEELKSIYHCIINFCIWQMRANENTDYYQRELYEMYQKGIASGLLLDHGVLSPWTYKNTFRLGLRLERFEETEAFIRENRSRLKPEFQNDAFHYNMAELQHALQQYDEALFHVNQVQFSDISYTLGTKRLSIMIFYEQAEWDVLESQLAAFGTYLKRHRLVAESVKLAYQNFVKCMFKIIRHDGPLSELKGMVEQTTPLEGRNWLMCMVGQRNER